MKYQKVNQFNYIIKQNRGKVQFICNNLFKIKKEHKILFTKTI